MIADGASGRKESIMTQRRRVQFFITTKVIRMLFVLSMAAGGLFLCGCGRDDSACRTKQSLFYEYVLDFDPAKHIDLEKIQKETGNELIFVEVERMPILPGKVFDDAVRLKAENRKLFDLLCILYMVKLEHWDEWRYAQVYPVCAYEGDTGKYELCEKEQFTNGVYFIYSNFNFNYLKRQIMGLTGRREPWIPCLAQHLMEEYWKANKFEKPCPEAEIVSCWSNSYERVRKHIFETRGYGSPNFEVH